MNMFHGTPSTKQIYNNDLETVNESLYYIHIPAITTVLLQRRGMTSLALAARLGYYKMVEKIVISDAFKSAVIECESGRIEYTIKSAVKRACRAGHLDVFKYLLIRTMWISYVTKIF
jgi:hypothetical protein